MKRASIINIYFLSLFFFVAVEIVDAQFQNMKFEYLTVDNGLSNNLIQCLFRDSKGYLWVGTQVGLNKFDGFKVKNYETIEGQNNSLSNNYIYWIFEDKHKNLWIGTDFGLNLFDRKTETFKRFLHDSKSGKSISSNSIKSIVEDQKGNIWVNTENGLNCWDANNQIFNQFFPPGEANKIGRYPEKISIDSNGDIWGAKGKTLWKFSTKSQHFTSYTDTLMLSAATQNTYVLVDSNGIVWIGINQKGLISFNEKTKKFIKYGTKADGKGIYSPHIPTMAFDGKHNLLIGGYLGGISRLNLKSSTFDYYFNDKNGENNIIGQSLTSIYLDSENILYVGSALGVSFSNPKKNRYQTFRKNIKESNSLLNNNVARFFEDSHGYIWINTEGGVCIFDPHKKTFKNYPISPRNLSVIMNKGASSFAEDKNSDIWLGTWEGGLQKYERKTGKYFRYMPNPKDPKAISYNIILDIIDDKKGNFLISYYPKGIDVFNIKDGVIKKYRHNPKQPNSLCKTWVDAFRRINDNEILLITPKGFGKFNVNTETFLWNKALEGVHVTDVYIDKHGNNWVGTYDAGLWIISAKGEIEKHNKTNGFSSNTVCCIVEDRQGNIWISTFNGINKYNTKTKKITNINEDDGLLGKQFSTNSYLKATDGKLYFGGDKGFNSFNPDSIVTNTTLPNVYIDEFQIFNKLVTPATPNSPLKNSITETKKIVLTYEQSFFSFGFTAINFTYREKVQYTYKLQGVDNDWVYIDAQQRKASYTNIDPGRYTFKVKASNNDGLWNEQETSVIVIITPPWWKTLWFRMLLIIIIVGGAFVFYFARISAMKRYQRVLENRVNKRTLKLEEANTMLEDRQAKVLQQNEIITQTSEKLKEKDMLKTRFFINISHDFRTPLTLILGPIESMIADFKRKNWIEYIGKLELVGRNAKRLLNLINQLIEIHKIESGAMNLKIVPTNITEFINEIATLFKDFADQHNIRLTLINTSQTIELYIDREKMEKVIFNLLSNAIKYNKPHGTIHIEIIKNNEIYENINNVEIRIKDTGIGIDSKSIAYIFEPFYQAQNMHTKLEESSGIGLSLCKSLIQLHFGSIEVQSELGQGSTFTIKLPLGKNHFKPEEIFEMTNYKLQIADDQLIITNYELRMTNDQLDTDIKQLTPNSRLPTSDFRHRTPNFGLPTPNSRLPTSDSQLPTILVVDDNADMRKYITYELQNDYQIIEAENGLEGFEKTIEFNPELIISDVMMPVIDGIEFCNNIKTNEITSHIPVLLLTARSSEESTIDGFGSGADDYIVKPFSAAVLKSRIKNVLHNREQLRQLYSTQIKIEPKEITLNAIDEKFMAKVLKIVEENISNADFSVVTLAEKTFMSRSNLFRKIKSLTGENVSDFILSMRMKKAAEMLQQSSLEITEIAYQSGFNDPKYFTTYFGKVFGKTPLQYRNSKG